MLKELVKLANVLDQKGLHREADYLDKIIKESGMLDTLKGLFKPEKEKLREELNTLMNEYAKLPRLSEQTKEEEERSRDLYDKIVTISRRLHEIDPEKEPFKDSGEREILKKAMLKYMKESPVYENLSEEQKDRIKILSIKWVFDGYDSYYWEVTVEQPHWDNPDDSSQDHTAIWSMWYGKSKDIYPDTVPFEIKKENETEVKKYYLAGES